MPRLDSDETTSAAEGADAGLDERRVADDNIVLPVGDALSIDQAAELTAERRHRLIALLGDRRAGKTTLLAELHQAFLKAPFGNYLFAGSDTVLAFEKRCALGRTASGLTAPDTPRTPLRDGVRLLQLRVRDRSLKYPVRELLLTDISGELSKNARRSAAEAAELVPILKCASRVVVVVDGAKLADARRRQRACTDAKTLLRALVEVGGLHPRSCVDIVITKYDYLITPQAEAFAGDFLSAAATAIKTNVKSIDGHRIAARVRAQSSVKRWLGMEDLLDRWAGQEVEASPRQVPGSARARRAFLNYGRET